MSKFFISLETTTTNPRICFRVGDLTLFAPLNYDGATLYNMSKFFIPLETTATKPRLCFRVGGETLFAPLNVGYWINPGATIDGATLYDMLLTMLPGSGVRTAESHPCIVKNSGGTVIQTRSGVTQYRYLPSSDNTDRFNHRNGIGCDGTKIGGSPFNEGLNYGTGGVMRNASYFFYFPEGLKWA